MDGGRIEKLVQHLDVDAGHARLDEIGDEGQVHPVLAQPRGGEKVFRLGGGVGERPGIAVDAESEKGRFLTGRGDALFLHGLTDEGAGGSGGADAGDVRADDLAFFPGTGGRRRMMVPDLHFDAGQFEEFLHVRDAGTHLRVDDDDPPHAGGVDLLGAFERIQKHRSFVEELVQRLFHAPRKDHDAVGVEHRHPDHRGQGVPVGIAVAGDDGGGGGQRWFHAVSFAKAPSPEWDGVSVGASSGWCDRGWYCLWMCNRRSDWTCV